MKFTRLFTSSNRPIEEQIRWKTVESKILAADGSVVFHMPEVEVPEQWSQIATDILAQKYLRKAGVPDQITGVEEQGVPAWLQRRKPAEVTQFGAETSAKGVFNRLAGAWTYWGWKEGYFGHPERVDGGSYRDQEESAKTFYAEIYWMLAHQFGAPNSPQWFNTGLHWAYGIEGPDSGQWITTEVRPHNFNGKQCWCGEIHGIYSQKSLAPRVTVEQIHNSYARPQISACFIQPVADDLVNPGGIMDLWVKEVRLFKHGSGTGTNFSSIRAKGEPLSGGGVSSGLMSFLKIGDSAAGAIKSGGVTRRAAKMCVLDIDHPEIEDFITWKVKEDRKARSLVAAGWDEDEAVETISGQNSNNSVRIPDIWFRFLDETGGMFTLTNRADGNPVRSVPHREIWQQICAAAWGCGDPGVQFQDTINSWHTCKADGEIRASNPCGEYLFLDDTACNLASLNLVKFLDPSEKFIDGKTFAHAVRLWITALDTSVSMASYPSREIALGSYNYRTLGLGYANLGGMLIRQAIAYDSDEGRNIAANVTRLMIEEAYITSIEIAQELGAFPRWEANRESMREVICKHGLSYFREDIPFRNAQVTLIAPTGTIALLMDCDTTGVEPPFALSTHKKLAGGGAINSTNAAVSVGLAKLNYTPAQIGIITAWIETGGELADMPTRNGEPFINPAHLPVFATAVGKNALSPEAHIRMVAAVQPFLSGGVSKTVNMPAESTVEDVACTYRLAHKLGLKTISIYRDRSKVTQPLTAKTSEESIASLQDTHRRAQEAQFAPNEINFVREYTTRGTREPLPPKRSGYAHKLRISDHAFYLHTGEYPDGTLGEIFISLNREGSTVRSIMECFAKAVSIGIQYGVPLEEFIEAFIHSKFEPAGIVQGHETIKMCSSIVDLIFRDLEINYLHADKAQLRELNLPPNVGAIKISEVRNEDFTTRIEAETGGDFSSPDICWDCGNATLVRAGSCLQCTNCGANSGCG